MAQTYKFPNINQMKPEQRFNCKMNAASGAFALAWFVPALVGLMIWLTALVWSEYLDTDVIKWTCRIALSWLILGWIPGFPIGALVFWRVSRLMSREEVLQALAGQDHEY